MKRTPDQNPTFVNAKGMLTAYAFACGYVEKTETMGKRLEMWHADACWHVRLHDFGFAGETGDGRIFWESFDSLTKARAKYASERAKLVHVDPLECAHADTCLPDYWGGNHLPHIQVAVHRGMSLCDLKSALHSELNQGAVCGSDPITRDDSGERGTRWFKRAHAAVNAIKPSEKGARQLFTDLDDTSDDDCADTVYAFFVFQDRG